MIFKKLIIGLYKLINKIGIKMKKIINYICVFLIIMFALFLLLVLTAKIPKTALVKSYNESTQYFYEKVFFRIFKEIDAIDINRADTYKHVYADAMIMNIIYCIDSDHAIQSVMEAKYYSTFNNKDIPYDFSKMIENDNSGNVEYIRYWHGSMSILRPLFVFFNIKQIYIINTIIITILAIMLAIMLLKTKIKELVIAYITGLIMCTTYIVPLCLEYTWTFIIMFVVSIISIILDKRQKNLNVLFLISGMVTCYLDFLTTELITVLVPLLIILVIRYNENRMIEFKQGLIFILTSLLFWGIGYIGMWISKWVLAAIILNVNIIDYVKEPLLNRVTTSEYHYPSLKAIEKNLFTLYPFNIIENKKILWLLPVSIIIIEIPLINKKNIKKIWFSALLLLVALIPYIRYAIIASHSFTHYFFTFRTQIVTIIAVILAVIYSIDTDIAKQKIYFRRPK